jgi:energy-coupling factor transporter ATP-binding protein EcfA2
VAYFDQMREQLDPEKTVAETISPGSEWVEIGGERKHVMSYLGDFLFPPRRAQSPVRMLSGGERNRLLLARLFARPANLLVLDEPTNDLDIESLELLEDTLQSYTGTLLLVSHDRAFLDNVATQVLVAEGDGHWREYVGGYSDWLRMRAAPEAFLPLELHMEQQLLQEHQRGGGGSGALAAADVTAIALTYLCARPTPAVLRTGWMRTTRCAWHHCLALLWTASTAQQHLTLQPPASCPWYCQLWFQQWAPQNPRLRQPSQQLLRRQMRRDLHCAAW